MGATIGQEFRPGDTCRASGIYRVVHDKAHVEEHEVTMVFEKTFPPCRGCGKGVKFVLIRAAEHVDNNKNF